MFDIEFIELLIEHQPDDANGLICVRSLRPKHQLGSLGGTEGQQAQNAPAVGYLTGAFKLDLALKASRSANQFVCWPHVQSLGIVDSDRAMLNGR